MGTCPVLMSWMRADSFKKVKLTAAPKSAIFTPHAVTTCWLGRISTGLQWGEKIQKKRWEILARAQLIMKLPIPALPFWVKLHSICWPVQGGQNSKPIFSARPLLMCSIIMAAIVRSPLPQTTKTHTLCKIRAMTKMRYLPGALPLECW